MSYGSGWRRWAGRSGASSRWDGPCKRWIGGEKKSFPAAERDSKRVKIRRRAFVEAVQEEEVTRFKFVDETSTNLIYCRRYARAEGGQRVGHGVPLHGGPNVTVVAALTPNGL